MSLEYIRNYYNVPAKKGARVLVPKRGPQKTGTITGANGPHVKVRCDGEKHSFPWHPTDVEYI